LPHPCGDKSGGSSKRDRDGGHVRPRPPACPPPAVSAVREAGLVDLALRDGLVFARPARVCRRSTSQRHRQVPQGIAARILSLKGFGLVSERIVSRSSRSGHWAGPVVISAGKPDYEIAADTPRSSIDQYVRRRRGQLRSSDHNIIATLGLAHGHCAATPGSIGPFGTTAQWPVMRAAFNARVSTRGACRPRHHRLTATAACDEVPGEQLSGASRCE
jgi:hypothetical protein